MEKPKEEVANSAINEKNIDKETSELLSKMKNTVEVNNKRASEIRNSLTSIKKQPQQQKTVEPQIKDVSNTNNQQQTNSNFLNQDDLEYINNTSSKIEDETYENQKESKKKKSTKLKKKKKSKLKAFFNFCYYSGVLAVATGLFLLYGPINSVREWYITTAMTTMTHQYLATWVYSQATIDDVLSRNRVVEVDDITDTSQIVVQKDFSSKQNEKQIVYANEYEKQVLEIDESHPDYKLIPIKEKNYEGYLAVVYDSSKIKTMASNNLGISGQYVTDMAKANKAVLAINGGGFEDENYNSAGGVPLGITMSNGKVLKSQSYNGPGGMIGFDTDDKLVLGKVSVDTAKKMNIRDCVTCGPFLIINGVSSEVLGNGGWGTAPRTAIGQRKDGIVLMLVVDGRKVGMPGADMDDLIEIMERYGAYNAAALDGGTSSVMVENYQIINDPVNGSGKHKTRAIATAFGVILGDDE